MKTVVLAITVSVKLLEVKRRHAEMRFIGLNDWLSMLLCISLNTILRQYVTQCH